MESWSGIFRKIDYLSSCSEFCKLSSDCSSLAVINMWGGENQSGDSCGEELLVQSEEPLTKPGL